MSHLFRLSPGCGDLPESVGLVHDQDYLRGAPVDPQMTLFECSGCMYSALNRDFIYAISQLMGKYNSMKKVIIGLSLFRIFILSSFPEKLL